MGGCADQKGSGSGQWQQRQRKRSTCRRQPTQQAEAAQLLLVVHQSIVLSFRVSYCSATVRTRVAVPSSSAATNGKYAT